MQGFSFESVYIVVLLFPDPSVVPKILNREVSFLVGTLVFRQDQSPGRGACPRRAELLMSDPMTVVHVHGIRVSAFQQVARRGCGDETTCHFLSVS